MTTFEDRLLAELREVVAARPAPSATTAIHARRRPWRLVAGTAVAAAAATAIVLSADGGGTTPAYAVERQPDGSVTVTINSLADADGLQAKLRAAGIDAVVDYTPAGKMCRQPRGRLAPGPQTMGIGGRGNGSTSFTIPRGEIKPGQTLVIMSSLGEGISSVGSQVIDGPVAPCQLIDAPAIPKGPVHSTGGPNSGTVRVGG